MTLSELVGSHNDCTTLDFEEELTMFNKDDLEQTFLPAAMWERWLERDEGLSW